MTVRRRAARAAALLLVAVLLVTGCGESSQPSDTGTGEAKPNAERFEEILADAKEFHMTHGLFRSDQLKWDIEVRGTTITLSFYRGDKQQGYFQGNEDRLYLTNVKNTLGTYSTQKRNLYNSAITGYDSKTAWTAGGEFRDTVLRREAKSELTPDMMIWLVISTAQMNTLRKKDKDG